MQDYYNMLGLWMPEELITTKEISDKQKFMYGMILYFSKVNKSCHIPNSYFMEKLHISKTQTSKLVNSLKEKGYIKSEVIRNEKNQIIDRIITPMVFFNNTYDAKVKSPTKENSNVPIEEKCKDNKKYNNKNIINKNNTLSNMYHNNCLEIDFNDNSLYANLR